MNRYAPRRYDEETKQEAIEASKNGMSVADIAKGLNIPNRTVYGWIHRIYVPLPKRSYGAGSRPWKAGIHTRRYDPKINKRALELHENGDSVVVISEKLNVPQGTVYTWIQKEKNGEIPAEITRNFSNSGKEITDSIAPKREFTPEPPIRHHEESQVRTPEYEQAPRKMTLDEFVQMLRELSTDYFKLKEELASVKKSNEGWKLKAGRALEQAQAALQRG